MAGYLVVQTAAWCTIVSFFFVSQSLERHSLTERPRLSSFLVLLLSGCICFITSLCSKWIPGTEGRFGASQQQKQDAPLLGTEGALLKGSTAHMPTRPRKLSLPLLIACLVVRLEILQYVGKHQQCSTPGIEPFLCPLLIAYEIFATRRKWVFPIPENPDDPWRSIYHDLYDWFSGTRVVMFCMVTSALFFSLGTALAVAQFTRSNFVCFKAIEGPFTIFGLQFLGLGLDVVIALLFWRILAWTKSIKLQLWTLGSILSLSGFCISIMWVFSALYSGSRNFYPGDSLYAFDVFVDSVAFACLMISTTLWMCESSPITPTAVVTLTAGLWRASINVFSLGDWEHIFPGRALGPLWLVTIGTIAFTYFHDLRSVMFLRRGFVAFLLTCLLTAATIFAMIKQPRMFDKRHPVDDIIYDAGVRHDRWLTQATTSGSFPVAVTTYQERHEGRVPPPKFEEWYRFAEKSTVIDDFKQIDNDLDLFWQLSPASLRNRADIAASQHGVETISVKSGIVTSSDPGDTMKRATMDKLAEMIRKFAAHLPDMVLSINLEPTPRILPSWETAHLQSRAELMSMVNLISRSANSTERTSAIPERPAFPELPVRQTQSSASFRKILSDACPPGSPMRTTPHWHTAEFCSACVNRHSLGQLTAIWQNSLEICYQPDMRHLHEFLMLYPEPEPIQELLPLFGPSKTDGFADILIPLLDTAKEVPDNGWQFHRKYDRLIWRGGVKQHAVTKETMRGGQKSRLLHLINDARGSDKVTMVLTTPSHTDRFGYDRVDAREADSVFPFSVALEDYSECSGADCGLMRNVYGQSDSRADPLEYRYVLLVDEEGGPPRRFMPTMLSLSVPFISTIFRSWYTERLTPWLHFVPVDPRYQGLHTTLAYFTGTENRGFINGKEVEMSGHREDAEWIALQGQKWAGSALGEREMEVYLFRLLLEWGRLIDDNREAIGVRKDDDGALKDSGWTGEATSTS